MEKSKLIPFIRNDLHILFVGLNPANGSSRNRHYFSVNASFWNQLFASGLITEKIDKMKADELVFGSSDINFNYWNFGITDLIIEIAESDSSKIKPSISDFKRLKSTIIKYNPKVVILLHSKVVRNFTSNLYMPFPKSNSGKMGYLIDGCPSFFYNIAFPHGNIIRSNCKIKRYKEVKEFIINLGGEE